MAIGLGKKNNIPLSSSSRLCERSGWIKRLVNHQAIHLDLSKLMGRISADKNHEKCDDINDDYSQRFMSICSDMASVVVLRFSYTQTNFVCYVSRVFPIQNWIYFATCCFWCLSPCRYFRSSWPLLFVRATQIEWTWLDESLFSRNSCLCREMERNFFASLRTELFLARNISLPHRRRRVMANVNVIGIKNQLPLENAVSWQLARHYYLCYHHYCLSCCCCCCYDCFR